MQFLKTTLKVTLKTTLKTTLKVGKIQQNQGVTKVSP